MLENIIKKSSNIRITSDGKEYILNNIRRVLLDLIQGSYMSPSFASGLITPFDTITQKDVWVYIHLDTPTEYLGEDVDEILFVLKPKYDFLTIFRRLNGENLDKCALINLSKCTTETLNIIKDEIQKQGSN